MAALAHSLILIIGFMLQSAAQSQALQPNALTAGERELLEKEARIENRIKIYAGASARSYNRVQSAIKAQQLEDIPEMLRQWLSLLDLSLDDVSARIDKKKKSKALKDFEIKLRRAILDVQSYKIKAPIEQQDRIDDWITGAERVRTRFMTLLFPQ